MVGSIVVDVGASVAAGSVAAGAGADDDTACESVEAAVEDPLLELHPARTTHDRARALRGKRIETMYGALRVEPPFELATQHQHELAAAGLDLGRCFEFGTQARQPIE